MSEDNLYSALAKAQAMMGNAVFNRVNPHFRNKYADLAAIRDATIPALSANGLSLVQFTTSDPQGNLVLVTRVYHKTGEFIEGLYPLPLVLDKPQIMGSALTYAKRYCWSSMCGIAADEDDDAEAATPRKSANKARKDGDWESMVGEMKAQKTPEDLKAWGDENRHRIHELPDNWQTHLKDEYARLMGLMDPEHPLKKRGRPRKERTEPYGVKAQLQASVNALTTAEAIDDEIPVGIENPDKYLDDLESQLAAAQTVDAINDVWEEYKLVMGNMFPPDRDRADKLFDRHQTRVETSERIQNPHDAGRPQS